MYDICAFGDILVDMTPMPRSPNGNFVYESNVGGTAANMAAACARFGLKILLVGKVGNDIMGNQCIRLSARMGVDISGIATDPNAFTTLSFVTLVDGERSFSFSRKNAADIAITMADVPVEKALNCKIFYFSGMCLTDEPVRSTTLQLVKQMKEHGKLICIDVNYRDRLWQSEEDFVETIPQVYPYLDIYKSSEEEIFLLSGEDSLEKATAKINSYGIHLVIVSCGKKGAFFRLDEQCGYLNTFDTKPVDTTGAGDCFMSAVLYKIHNRGGLDGLRMDELKNIIEFANAAGAVSITGRGGASSMPTIEDVERCRSEVPKLLIPWK